LPVPFVLCATFESFPESAHFTYDAHSVFYKAVVEIADADPQSFTPLTDCFGKDAERGYIGVKPIPVADIATWQVLSKGTAGDPWYRSQHETHPRDPAGLLAFGWSKDSKHVYWGDSILQSADSVTFTALSPFYGKDQSTVYSAGEVLEGADSASFVVADPPPRGPKADASDNNRSYKYGKPIE
jgi:hypothetical protein